MRTFVVGAVVGLLLGASMSAAAQWTYVPFYTGKDLVQTPAYAGMYAYGVADALTAVQYHIRGGGAGQPHIDKAWACLRRRGYAGDFSKWAQSAWKTDMPRPAALMLIDHACDASGSP